MKTGIVTFPEAINYGTSLQAAALGKALAPYSDEVVFLRHRCEEIDRSNAVFDIKSMKDPKYTAAHLYNLTAARERKKNFDRFIAEHIPLSDKKPSGVDTVVAGSDQIWNVDLTGGDLYYFLDFEKKNTRKTAYAASFGLSALDKRYHADLKRLLADFDTLSVRERTAAAIIKDICDIDVPVVVDPTLLITPEEWNSIAAPTSGKGGYIYVYTVFNSEKLWKFAYDLSKKTGLPIKTVSYSKLHRHDAEYSFTAGPAEWLRYIADAEYVITNSFHGFAFSVNFGKQFFFELPPAASGVSSRLTDMAERYGLLSREISSADMTAVLEPSVFASALREDAAFSREFIRDQIFKK